MGMESGVEREYRQELETLVSDMLAILGTLVNHAKEAYPHFESSRGQGEIAEATLIIERAIDLVGE